MSAPAADTGLRTIDLPVAPIERAAFAPFGTLIEPAEDGEPFGARDAELELARGTPRFYIMRLKWRDLAFRQITRHLRVTQCLASVGGKPWLIAVAPPHAPDDPAALPEPGAIRAFGVPGSVAIKLHRGTWHAGPFFHEPALDFFNLELADTNETDHRDCRLDRSFGLLMRFGTAA
jgi:ureidoglycolate hydrolase